MIGSGTRVPPLIYPYWCSATVIPQLPPHLLIDHWLQSCLHTYFWCPLKAAVSQVCRVSTFGLSLGCLLHWDLPSIKGCFNPQLESLSLYCWIVAASSVRYRELSPPECGTVIPRRSLKGNQAQGSAPLLQSSVLSACRAIERIEPSPESLAASMWKQNKTCAENIDSKQFLKINEPLPCSLAIFCNCTSSLFEFGFHILITDSPPFLPCLYSTGKAFIFSANCQSPTLVASILIKAEGSISKESDSKSLALLLSSNEDLGRAVRGLCFLQLLEAGLIQMFWRL